MAWNLGEEMRRGRANVPPELAPPPDSVLGGVARARARHNDDDRTPHGPLLRQFMLKTHELRGGGCAKQPRAHNRKIEEDEAKRRSKDESGGEVEFSERCLSEVLEAHPGGLVVAALRGFIDPLRYRLQSCY